MITPEQGLTILQDTIRYKRRHRDYTRVCELADLYHKLISGENIGSLLKRFNRRESDEEFKQREALTVHITEPLAESIKAPFYRLGRLDNIKRNLNYERDNGTKREALEEVLSTFWGNEHLERYLATRLPDLNFSDPNAFVLVDFEEFDYRKDTAKPYPYEISTHEAIHFDYSYNTLNWLICHTIKDEVNPDTSRTRKQERYYLYAPDFVLTATQIIDTSTDVLYFDVEQGLKPLKDYEVWGDNFAGYYENAGKRFTFEMFRHKAGRVQAVRVGYKPDQVTNGRTFVSPMHAAVPYFMKLIKSVSELDLSVSLHVFPQKSTFAEPCHGSRTAEGGILTCDRGTDQFGKTCKSCNGSGIQVHKSSQDMMVFPLPTKLPANEILPLSERQHYHELPIHIVNWLDGYIDKLTVKAVKAVYNSDIIERPQFGTTATEVSENKEEMHNALFPFAEKHSAIYRHLVTLAAIFTDKADGLEVVYEFPSDYKLKTEAQMLADLKLAKDSGASAFMVQEIEKDIAKKRFADDEDSYKKYLTKTLFTPFMGKSEAYITMLFQSNDVRQEDKVLYNYVDSIFDELQMEVEGFFDLPYKNQNPLVMEKVKALMEQMPKAIIPTLDLTNESTGE